MSAADPAVPGPAVPGPAVPGLGVPGPHLPGGPLVPDGGVGLPALALDLAALEHNIASMAAWCRGRGVLLAPHGKTSMVPEVFARQLAAGAWAMTVATARQARTAVAAGAPRVLVANVVVEPRDAVELGAHADTGVEVLLQADSVAGVAALDAALRARGQRRPVGVLVEVGVRGARTGVRSTAQALAVAAAVRRSPVLALAGVTGYEGLVTGVDQAARVAAARAHLRDVRAALLAVAEGGWEDSWEDDREDGRAGGGGVVSAGGSAFFDLVVEELGPRELVGTAAEGAATVLRSGCYVVHGVGTYHRDSPLDGRAPVGRAAGEALRPALALWSTVLSRPEPDLAVLGFGKRETSADWGPPVPVRARTPAGVERAFAAPLEVLSLHDQHVVVRVPVEDGLAVGDRVASAVEHPCTTLDRWRDVCVVDGEGRLLETWHPQF